MKQNRDDEQPKGYLWVNEKGRADYIPNFDHPDNQGMLVVMVAGVLIAIVVGAVAAIYDFLFVGTPLIRWAVVGGVIFIGIPLLIVLSDRGQQRKK